MSEPRYLEGDDYALNGVEGEEESEIYDSNNNCFVCDQYIYDQHKTTCKHYVKETYLEFIKRIQKAATNA